MYTYVLDGFTVTLSLITHEQPAAVDGQTMYVTLYVNATVSETIKYGCVTHLDATHIRHIESELTEALKSGNYSLKFTDDSYKLLNLMYNEKSLTMGGDDDNTHLVMKDYIKYKGLEEENTKLHENLTQLKSDYAQLVTEFAKVNQHLADIDAVLESSRRHKE